MKIPPSVGSSLVAAGGLLASALVAQPARAAEGGAAASADARAGAPAGGAEAEWAERERRLNEASTLTGGVGLLHTQHAAGGAPGQFRIDFTTEWFRAGFLCSNDFPCPDPHVPGNLVQKDRTEHFGGRLRVSAQLFRWLEGYLATAATANSNPANRPALLQVLGDSTLGAKAHGRLSKIVSVGGAYELWLVNGTGSVGLDGAGTSMKFRGLATADLRETEKHVPLRFSTNLTYVLDNSGQVVADTEQARGTPITRIERYGLNVNRVDHLDIHLGLEAFAAEEKLRPFVEYQVLVPINRQDYACRLGNASNDKCLALDPFAPSTLTLGGRFFPWKRGFNVTAAFDVGVSGTSFFIEEMRPTPPWVLYLGAGWAFDTHAAPPVVRVVQAPAPAGRRIRGFVHEKGKPEGVPRAIVSWASHPELTALATGDDGRFTTHALPAGTYVFDVRAEGYESGQCQTTLGRSGASTAAPGPLNGPAPAEAGGEVQLDCPLEALPRVGNVVGEVRDLETGAVVAGASIRVTDVARRELTGASDPEGGFRFEGLTPGEARVIVDAEGYLAASERLDVKVRADNPIALAVRRKPKTSLVSLRDKEIVLKQQVQFAVDSARILPASNTLLVEIADVLLKNPRIRRVEVQGHTDGTGTPTHNQKLSEDRAASVVAWLAAHGIAAERLTARGWGDTKPLAPNVTAPNRARNRRVQFIIIEQDAPSAAPSPAPLR